MVTGNYYRCPVEVVDYRRVNFVLLLLSIAIRIEARVDQRHLLSKH
jgi:hypothetical protein